MRIHNLYLNIYVTVVSVLLVFAFVAGLLVRDQAQVERRRFEEMMVERSVGLGSVIGRSLPPAEAPAEQQAAALTDTGERVQMELALETADGRRIAQTERFEREQRGRDRDGDAGGRSPLTRVTLADGRVLWMARPHPPWDHRNARDGGPGGGGRGPGPGMRPPPGGGGGPFRRMLDEGLILLAVLFIAIAAGSYPVVRRLTRRLETLRKGVETFGAGALDYRVPVQGDDEVSAVAASFNRTAQRVEDLVRANRSLLANASHELRSPLARLKMAVSMLDTAGAAQRETLRHEIDVDIRELDVLVEEVLLASRLDAQPASELRELVELGPLLIEEAARVQAGTELSPEAVGLQVLGDERLLRRALRNLLENGRRYGGDELVTKLHQDGSLLRVQVCDRGPGVPESERERIFEPFYRLAGHSETAGGIGLGLSLVRQIAQRHGGTVACHPRDGGGSCFELALPLAALQR
jgi:signal transduction histidine kinase